MAHGDRWSREETIAALSLYAQIPFGSIHHTNPRVVALATAIGRTPSSVSYRLTNLASLDPELRARGIKGMSNASALDREVWKAYYGRWDDLAHSTATVDFDDESSPHTPIERRAEASQRIGQAFFRRAVLAAWDNACCVTGLSVPALLRASHIVPWSADQTIRINPRNGLCLNALHDAAFDRGLMTINESLRVVYARDFRAALSRSEASGFLTEFEGRTIRSPTRFIPRDSFFEHHRTKIYIGD